MNNLTDENIEEKADKNSDADVSEPVENSEYIVPIIDLADKISQLPTKPGIYQYFNQNGKIIYVGKAKNLRNRVRSYFQQGRPVDAKTKALVLKIADLEVIVTDNESEALILEDTLIKKHKPKYNIMLRDDKSYPYVRVTNEEFPRIFATRKIIKDGSKYFGPFTEVRQLKSILRILRTVFMFRSCDLKLTEQSIEKKKFKICLDYHIKKCDGPCEGFVAKEFYNEKVKNAIQIILGKTRDLEKKLEKDMQKLSEEMKFEEAAIVRNRYLLLKDYISQQKIVSNEIIDRDVFALARLEETACTLIFKIRDGKLIGKRHFIITNAKDLADENIIQTTIEKWYLENEFIPKEIFLPCEPDDLEFVTEWLSQRTEHSIDIQIPKIGDKKKLVTMAQANAEFMLRDYLISIAKREQTIPRVLLSIQRDLHLKKPPIRIECIDNSHIQGSELVSSVVVFENGKPKKSDYRKFKIKTVDKNDDFAAMQEVVRRRYTRLIEEQGNEKATPIPDLIIIDGGKGQLSHAVEILKELNIFDKVVVIGLAKRIDEIFFPGKSDSVLLPKSSSSLKLIQHIRDEAHRFAITFHRQLRDKRTIQTELTQIKGLGEKTAQKLLIALGSVENIKKASYDELIKIANKTATQAIIDYFSNYSKKGTLI